MNEPRNKIYHDDGREELDYDQYRQMMFTADIEFEKVWSVLKTTQSQTAQIRYLEMILDESGYSAAFKYYWGLPDDEWRGTPYFWQGMIQAARQMLHNPYTGESGEAFSKGIREYWHWCQLEDALTQLRAGECLPVSMSDMSKNESENIGTSSDYIRSVIDGYLSPFSPVAIRHHSKACEALSLFFSHAEIAIPETIFVRRGNKKKLAFALGEIYRTLADTKITLEYLQIAKQLFEVFREEDIDSKPVSKTNLFKYMTSKISGHQSH